jgi:hypothetical protein
MNIVITSNTNRVTITFNDYSLQAGMTSGNWQKAYLSASLNIGDTDVFFIVREEQQWRFSYNGSPNSMQVDSINGLAPVNNIDLLDKLNTIFATQLISFSDTEPINPNINDMWIDTSP